jgi:RpiB/LacA/LacB family sugar-phosphate isomerase
MKIAIAGDSAGVPLVQQLAPHLAQRAGTTVTDLSKPPAGSAEFYANMAERVAAAVVAGEYDRGILCCGTGIGVCISANKVPGMRAALTHDVYSAVRAAKSNNAQIITMGARVIGIEHAKCVADAWLDADFDPAGPSATNVTAIDALDAKHRR